MRLIKQVTVRQWARLHGKAKAPLEHWLVLVKKAKWQKFTELKVIFPSADQVILASGRTVIIFNIAGNNYRLIAAVHFNKQRIYALRFMTHAEYSKEEWKKTL